MDIGIGGYRGADVNTNRCSVDQFHLLYIRSFYRTHMVRQLLLLCQGFQAGDQAFQYQGGLSGTGDSCDQGKSAFWNVYLQVL